MSKFSWDIHEKEVWTPPPEILIDEWAEQNLVLPRSMSAFPGPLSLDLNPYLREVLRCATDPETEEVTLKWGAQQGKTIALIIIVYFYAKNDPWPAIHVMPRDEDAESINVERYQAVLKESPALQDLRLDERWAENMDCIRLKNMNIFFTGAQSPAGLASRSACLCMLDEVNKWPPWSGKEADPIRLARERTKWFTSRKIFKTSTPTTSDGYISKEFELSSKDRFWVPCPHCGWFQVLVFGQKGPGPGIKWPEDIRDPHKIKAENLAWYECIHCRGKILDGHKPQMLRRGKWISDGGEISIEGVVSYPKGRPSKRYRGFHLWAAYSPVVTFSEVVSEFLICKDSPQDMMNFVNSWLAEDWNTAVNELRAPELRVRQDVEYSQGKAPTNDCWLITAGVDVQRPAGITTMYYVLRGWGREEESWLIKCGTVIGWEDLYQVIHRSVYRNPGGGKVPVITALIDSGDGVNTLEVYDFCLATGCTPTKGASRPLKYVTWSNVDRAGKNLPLCLINTGYYKSKLHQLARQDKWHLPNDIPEEYFSHMVAEQLISGVDKRTGKRSFKWQVTSPGTANHYFDCEVLCLVGADLLQVPQADRPPLAAANPNLQQTVRRVVRERIFSG